MTSRGAELERIHGLDVPASRPESVPDVTGAHPAEPRRLPNRYRIREDAEGRYLTCVEAPTLTVRVRRGVTVTAAVARSSPPGTIYLDGAAQAEPFMDAQRCIYNLDHHEGCIRAFTLATCEQAMVLVRKFVDLRKRDWTVHANDADLDTLLAIWVLLNHFQLNAEDGLIRERIMPLLRLEGAIDTHGLEHLDLTALNPDSLETARSWMDRLLQRETALKARGAWQKIELLEYVADRLRAIDALVYPPTQFGHIDEIDELARVEIAPGSVAVACRSEVGIYEVERQLRRFHGDRLGAIILQKDETTYSLRQVDPELPGTLEKVYARLNLVDPVAGGTRSANRWGGSAEIGGSPRSTGTQLRLAQITEAFRNAFAPPSLASRVKSVVLVSLCTTAAMLAGLAAIPLSGLLGPSLLPAGWLSLAAPVWFGAVLLVGCALFALTVGRRAPGLYGLRRPEAAGWWALLPVALLGAAMGGVWTPDPRPLIEGASSAVTLGGLACFLAFPIAAELLFRGLAHGTLAWSFPIQHDGGPWFLSVPVLVSSALYAPWVALPIFYALPLNEVPELGAVLPDGLPWALASLGGLLFGITAGIARERSESVISAILLHWICIAAVVVARSACL